MAFQALALGTLNVLSIITGSFFIVLSSFHDMIGAGPDPGHKLKRPIDDPNKDKIALF